jgi:hypothetical protein
MKQFNLPRAIIFTRIVFLITALTGIVFVAARSSFTSRASNKSSLTTTRDNGRKAPLATRYAPVSKTSMLSPLCTTDPVVVNNSDSGAGSLRQAITDACGGSTITFNMATNSLITLTTAELSINKNLTITGTGSSVLTVRRSPFGGTPNFRVFNISSGTVSISGLTVTNGKAEDGTAANSAANGGDGGGILNTGTLSLSDVTLTGNTAGSGGTGVNVGGRGGQGGGVYNSGTLIMTSCIISGNNGGRGGNATSVPGDGGSGGGVFNSQSLTMTDCQVTANNSGGGGDGGASFGGNGGSGGGISINSGSGTGALTNLVIANNHAGDTGSHGGGGNGGGIDIEPLTVVTLTNSTVSGNRSGTSSQGGPGFAGGILNQGVLTMTGSTIANNTTLYVGGGILNRTIGAIKITNCTISGNQAPDGGGMYEDNSSGASLTNCTITNNSPNGITTSTTHPQIRNTIIAGDTTGADVSGTFTSEGNNLIGKSDGTNGFANGSNGDQVGTVATPLDPRLGSLANNGGTTQTYALLADSTAIDAGNNCVLNDSCSPALGFSLTTDQRGAGFNRAIDGNGDGTATVDIGAYEVHTILVTNTADSGAGSLRQAITDANANGDTNAITFQAGLTGTIDLLTSLPDLTSSMSFNGPGANQMTVQRSTVGGTPEFRIFTINTGKNVYLSRLTISNGHLSDRGGGISNYGNLTILNCTVSGNTQVTGGWGGGIYNDTVATLNVTNSIISGNSASDAGGIANFGALTLANSTVSGNSSSGSGGGIWSFSGSTLTVTNSTISGNTAADAAGGIESLGPTTLTNTTISGNTAGGSGGGLMRNGPTASATLTNVTITNNHAGTNGGGALLNGGNDKLRNTIVAGNFLGGGTSTPNDIEGVVDTSAASSNNLIGTGGTGGLTAINGNQINVANPGLGPLANNGGPTLTNALLPSSPALNAGSNALATNAGLTTDQRGSARIVNTTVDVGAFESRGFTIVATGGTPQSAPILTAFNSSLVATVSNAFGEPVTGGTVIFTAPSSGASGIFPGSVTTSNVTIDANGLATVPVFTANGTAGGPYNVVASLAGGSPPANFTLTNSKGNQTITVNTHAPASLSYSSSFTVAAVSSSGLPVSYSNAGSCNNTGATFQMNLSTGTCTVKYDQFGDANYNAAPQVTEFVTAQKADQTITVNTHAPTNATYNTNFTVAASASSGLAVAYSSSGACTFEAGFFIMTSGTGTCTVLYDQIGGTNFNSAPQVIESVTAQKANQTISVNTHAPASATYNGSFTVAAQSIPGLAVSYSSSGVCTNVGATFTMTSGTGTCTVRYDQSGDSNYNAATQVTESVTAQKASQTISFGPLSSKTVGDPDFGVSATASSSLTVSFTASPASVCTISANTVHITGAGACTITAKQAGDTNYNAAPDLPQLFNVASATTTGVTSSVNPSEFGQSVTFTATVTSGAGTPTGTVQFKDGEVNLGAAQTLNAGGVAQLTISSLTAGTHTITANYSGDVNFLTSTGSLSGGQVVKSPTLSINDVSFAEGNSGTTSMIFTVTLSAASNLTVNVNYATANGTATLADNDYQALSGTLTFNPGDLTRTITVLVNGDQKFEPDETVLVNLTSPVNATISDSQGAGTILNDDTLQLILDESGPDANQAAAFDSFLFLRDPFHVQNVANWIDLGADPNTRVILFAANLQLNQGETASAVVVNLVDANNQSFDVPAEDVRSVPNFAFTQVRFRLPNALAGGACMVTIKAHGQISNTGTMRIVLP